MTIATADRAARLSAALGRIPTPIAITFSATNAPAGVIPFDAPLASARDDGRTGRVAAGCVFWMHAVDRTFSTVAQDHANCSVGSLTHGFIPLAEAASRADVAAIVESGWVTMAEAERIPTVSERPSQITYGPLAESVVEEPDVILIRIDGRQLMVLHDALPGLRVEGKPQCHIVAVAKEQGDVAVSVGCALSRARTQMSSQEMTCAIPGARLDAVIDAIERTGAIDSQVASYAGRDAQRFRQMRR